MTSRFSWRFVIIGLAVVLCVLPVIWTVLASLDISPPAFNPSLEHYREVVIEKSGFMLEVLNSLILAALTTFLTGIIATLAAYGIARSRFAARAILVQSLLVLSSLPVIAFVIPLRNMLGVLHLTDSLIGTALAEVALYAPFATYVLLGYINKNSSNTEHAARLEGATVLQVLRFVVLPGIASGLAATLVIVFVFSWNQLLIPMSLNFQFKTVPMGMIDFFTFERELDWGTAAAALVVSLTPILLVVFWAQRLLEQFRFSGSD